MGKSIFAELRSSWEFLARVERKIAEVILEKSRWFVTCTMAQLFVLDTLCSYLFNAVWPEDRKQHEKLMKIISSHSIRD